MGKVKFNRPDKRFHVYVSADETPGYLVEKTDDAEWTASFDKKKVTSRQLKTRAEAFAACDEHFDPTPAKLTNSEHSVLAYVTSQEGQCPLSDITSDGKTEMSPSQAITVLRYLFRRKLIEETGSDIKITESGTRALEAFVPRVRKTPEFKTNSAETRYGPRPDWAIPPTKQEMLESKVRRYQAAYDDSMLDRRMHPWSAVAEKKTATALSKFNAAKDKLEAFLRGEEVTVDEEAGDD